MKTFLLLILTVVISSLYPAFATPVSVQDTGITAGAGYSNDTQQVAPQYCFAAKAGPLSGVENHLNLDTALSFTDIEQQLKFSVSASGGYGMFSASAEASYLRQVEDKDYSFSLNYYEYADGTVPVQLEGFGEKALTPVGQQFYQDGQNKYFGVSCGDNYISSYKEGALLTMALNIKFRSHYEKEEFEAKAGASYANIFSASAHIQEIATTYHMEGQVSIQAYQRGGEPSQLSKILSKDPDGKYYVLSCDIQHMDDCTRAADGLLAYARNDFPNQFSFEHNTGLTALGLGFASYEPIYRLGLKQPDSFVTPQVLNDRKMLATDFKNNSYYDSKLDTLVNGYPVSWDMNSDFYTQLATLQQKAKNNVDVLTGPADNPSAGALGCYNTPEQCDKIYQTLQSNLQPITAKDLQFLAPLEYFYQDAYANYFYKGDTDSWGFLPIPDEDHIQKVIYSYFADPKDIHYQIATSGPQSWIYTYQNGIVQTDGKTVRIQKERNDGGGFHPAIIYRCKSPFFFTLINWKNKTGQESSKDACSLIS